MRKPPPDVSQAADHLLYRQETARCSTAMPGQEVSIAVDCLKSIYGRCLRFMSIGMPTDSLTIASTDNGTPADGSELWPTLMPKTATAAATS